jgi:hypothetical protein
MVREVKIELDDELTIKVIVDDVVKKEIIKDDRQITSLMIYESLDCDYESKYELVPIQEKGSLSDAIYDVLKTFYDLYDEIIDEVNEIIAKETSETIEQIDLVNEAK